MIWAKSAGGIVNDEGKGIAVDRQSNVYVTGRFKDTFHADSLSLTSTGIVELFLIRYETRCTLCPAGTFYDGSVETVKLYGGALAFGGHGFASSNGRIVTSGLFADNITFDNVTLYSSAMDTFVTMYDSSTGKILWARTMNGTSFALPGDVIMDSHEHVYVLINFEQSISIDSLVFTSSGGYDVLLAKLHNNGSVIWTRQVSGPGDAFATGITIDQNDDILFIGYFTQQVTLDSFQLTASGSRNVFVAKYNSSGSLVWARNYNAKDDNRYRIQVDSSGNLVLSGSFSNIVQFDSFTLETVGFSAVFVVKCNSTGAPLWATQAGFVPRTRVRSTDVAIDSFGNIYITGSFSGNVDFGNYSLSSDGGEDIFVACYSSSGNVSWVKRAGSFSGSGVAIAVDAADHVYVTGQFTQSINFDPITLSAVGASDVFVVSFSKTGSVIWAKQVGSANNDQAADITVDSRGNVFAIGALFGDSIIDSISLRVKGQDDVFLLHFNPIACAPCIPGRFSSSVGAIGSTNCKECPAGKYSNSGSSECSLCLPGTFSTSLGSANCTQCSIGTFSVTSGATSISTCVQCPVGTYSSLLGASSCQQCLSGTYNAETGKSVCTLCPPGTYSRKTGATSEADCLPCPVGKFSADEGSTLCQLCDAGTYTNSPGQVTCTKCHRGTYSILPGAVSNSSCITCPAGTYSNIEGATSEDDCIPCPAGTYSTALGAVSIASCQPCQPGTYSTFLGANSATNCTLCPSGTYSTIPAAASVSACLLCPAGTFSSSEGAASVEQCMPCLSGTYSIITGANSNTTCTNCPEGTYSSIPGASSISTCLPCPAGTYSTVQGAISISVCVACKPGTFSGALGAFNASTCKECPIGTYSSAEGATSISSCSKCLAGTFAHRIGMSECDPCPVGTSSSTIGAQSMETCKLCEVGTYADTPGSTACKACLAGSYSDQPSAPKCKLCTAGTYSLTAGAASISACIPCPAGTWSNQTGAGTDSTCIPCPAGTFSTIAAASSMSVCKPCPAGTFGNAGFCVACPTGTYSPYQAATSNATCLPCPLGTYNPNEAAQSLFACRPCPVGTFSNKRNSV